MANGLFFVAVSVSPAIVVGISGVLGSVSGAGSAARAHNLKIMTGGKDVFGGLEIFWGFKVSLVSCIFPMCAGEFNCGYQSKSMEWGVF